MDGYLEGYGAGDERRVKIIKWTVAIVLAVVVVTGTLYFTLRDRAEKKQIDAFLDLLRAGSYQQAYQVWGCTAAHPCPDYVFDKFLEDWGPKSGHGDYAKAQIDKTRSCDTGIIATIEFAQGDTSLVWVERKDKTLSFSPWPVCNPKMKPAYGP